MVVISFYSFQALDLKKTDHEELLVKHEVIRKELEKLKCVEIRLEEISQDNIKLTELKLDLDAKIERYCNDYMFSILLHLTFSFHFLFLNYSHLSLSVLLLLSSVDRADYFQKFTLHFFEIFRFHKKTRSSDIVKYPLVKCRGYFSETIFIFVSRACTSVYYANTSANQTSTKILLYFTILA